MAAPSTDPAAVVSALGAVQAQDYAGSLWSVGLRTAAVEQAIAEQRIVRTWAWKILRRALCEGPRLRDELMEALEARGIATANLRGYQLLWRLALERRICFGSRTGRQHTLVLAEDWLLKGRRPARRAALAGFAAWSGLTIVDARDAVSRVSAALTRDVVGGIEYLRSRDDTPSHAASALAVLLPGFDEYVIGYRSRAVIIEARHAPKLTPPNNGLFQSTLVIGGRVRGVWRRELEQDRVNVTIAPFSPLRPRSNGSTAPPRRAVTQRFLGAR